VIRATLKTDCDHSQRALLKDDVITVTNYMGRRKVYDGGVRLSVQQWEQTERGPSANPNWNKIELIRELSKDWPYQTSEDYHLLERIRDTVVRVVDLVTKQSSLPKC